MTRRRSVRTIALLGCVCLALVTACSSNDKPASSTRSGASPGATASTPVTATPRAVAIYYAGDAGSAGVRLYREFHALPHTDTDIRDAVDAIVSEPPVDPDYRTLWPPTALAHTISTAGNLATIDMAAAPAAATKQIAVQQLVWTVTAADPSVTRVQILVRTQPLTPAPVSRAAAVATLGPVWVLAPASGATVGRTFTISGDAAVFEATVSWEIRQGSTVLRHGFVTASKGAPARGTWQVAVTVPSAGSYVVAAFESSAKDGSAQFVDTKSITVR